MRFALFVLMICFPGVAGKKMGVEERQAQKSYWEEHSKNLTVEAMMLDSRAADLDKEERPEVIVSAMMFSPLSIPLFVTRYLGAYILVSTLFSAFRDPCAWIWAVCISHSAFAPQYHMAISEGTRVWK